MLRMRMMVIMVMMMRMIMAMVMVMMIWRCAGGGRRCQAVRCPPLLFFFKGSWTFRTEIRKCSLLPRKVEQEAVRSVWTKIRNVQTTMASASGPKLENWSLQAILLHFTW